MGTQLPEKTYFKIGEAASIVGVEPHTIRYWEKEFRSIRPAKTRSKQRLFRQKDVQLLLVIRHLVHAERFTIDGARRKLKELSGAGMSVESILDAIEAGRPLDPEVQQEAEKADDLRDQVGSLRGELARTTAELEALRDADTAQLTRDLARANATCDALRATVDALRAELEKTRARVAAVEADNLALRSGAPADGELRSEMRDRWAALLQRVSRTAP